MIANLSQVHLMQIKLTQRECRAVAKDIGAKIRRTRNGITLTLANGDKHTFHGYMDMYGFLIKQVK
ncbi:hypothetical protein ABE237_00705 [Brevibacillus formosus]|uniref:hypothetical protein n=1 Tax=Brevibacillus formosus TaxID=54913 RepID=UPI0018CC8162|nr:hypothetical protein [Brevibacillus formosus]MBG9944669.1 hypothetical protein [Brevibacillus formosus]